MPTPAPPTDIPPSAPAEQRRRVWTAYWATGALHSCAGSFAGNYGGAIRGFWEQVFRALPASARVLDLCCGNAPLAQLLLELRGEESITMDAVDAAAVAPGWLDAVAPTARARVRVHSGTDVANLPFAGDGFDLCVSQYGIEYVGTPAMAEARRVLRPGGRFAAVLHHAQSLPVQIAREDLQHLAWLGGADGLFAATAAMLRPMALSATGAGRAALATDADAQAARARFNAVQQQLERRIGDARWPDTLHDTQDACAAVLAQARAEGEAAGRGALARLQADMEALALRDRELVACALDAAGVRALLGDWSADARIGELRFDSGEIAGWSVVA